MKKYIIVLLVFIVTISCKAQTILTLGGDSPEDLNELPKPIFIKIIALD